MTTFPSSNVCARRSVFAVPLNFCAVLRHKYRCCLWRNNCRKRGSENVLGGKLTSIHYQTAGTNTGRRRGPDKSLWQLKERRNFCKSLFVKRYSKRLLVSRTHRCETYIKICVSEMHYGGISAGVPCSEPCNNLHGEKLTVNSKIWCGFSEL
jgi:hypothetical protein